MADVINAASDAHRRQMQALADFCGLDKIIYKDHGHKEDYTLFKDGKFLRLTAAGNQYDGGFLVVKSSLTDD